MNLKNNLKKNKHSIYCDIIDADYDFIRCEFASTSSVIIDTKKYDYIDLTKSNLIQLLENIDFTDKYFFKNFKNKKNEL